MKVKVLFFGVLAEEAGCSEKSYEGVTDTALLTERISEDIPRLSQYSYRIAVNRSITEVVIKLTDGDEVAFMPPFAGG